MREAAPLEALEALAAKDAIVDVVNELFRATDERDWAAVRACFAPVVHFDMTSVAGGAPAELSGERIAAAWEEGLRSVEAIHHQAGNHRVRVAGERAEACCYGTAWHWKRRRDGRNTRVFVGTYELGLVRAEDRWVVDRFRFVLKFVDGNLELEREE
jgi:hypothetical protein